MSSRALFSATSKSSTRKNKRRPLPGEAFSGLVKEGCSCEPHWWRQSKTVPSVSRDLTKVVMVRRCLGLAEERLVPFRTTGNVSDADDRPRAFHRSSSAVLAGGFHRGPFPDER